MDLMLTYHHMYRSSTTLCTKMHKITTPLGSERVRNMDVSGFGARPELGSFTVLVSDLVCTHHKLHWHLHHVHSYVVPVRGVCTAADQAHYPYTPRHPAI